jgi:hypothetical protein
MAPQRQQMEQLWPKAVYEPVTKLEPFYTGGAVRVTRDNQHLACACGDEVKVRCRWCVDVMACECHVCACSGAACAHMWMQAVAGAQQHVVCCACLLWFPPRWLTSPAAQSQRRCQG